MIYQRALEDLLTENELPFEPQKLYEVYDGPDPERLLGYYVPDFVIEEKVVLEIKAVQVLDNAHLAQVIAYLTTSGCPLGLLVNFGQRSLEYKRIFPPKSVQEHQVNPRWLTPRALKEEGHQE